jgi:hypothetical protein
MVMRGRLLGALTVTAAAASVLVGGPGLGVAAAAVQPVITDFALGGRAWSTSVSGGAVSVASGPTGAAYLGCTRFAHLERSNNTLAAGIPAQNPLLAVGATSTRVWTEKAGGVVSSNSLNTVAEVVVGNRSASALVLEGVRTRTRVWHDASGFHRSSSVTLAGATQYVAGIAIPLVRIPAGRDLSGTGIDIPGLVTVGFGSASGQVTGTGAVSQIVGVTLELGLTGTVARIGHGRTSITAGAVSAVMGGAVWGSQLSAVGRLVNSGRTALQPLPCTGTQGIFRRNVVAATSTLGLGRLSAVESKVRGDQSAGGAYAHGISTIAEVDLAAGLRLTAVRAEGLVQRKPDGTLVRSAAGTSLGSLHVNGHRVRLPNPGQTLTLPGVARVTPRYVQRTPHGIRVSAVRVQLLDGTTIESTLVLGNVNLTLRRG